MFRYTFSNDKLYIRMPKVCRYTPKFHHSIAKLLKKVIHWNDIGRISRVVVQCDDGVLYDKLCKANLFNVFTYLSSQNVGVYINRWFRKNILDNVVMKKGQFDCDEIDLAQLVISDNIGCHMFCGDENVEKPVENVVGLITDNSFTLDKRKLKEFLTTVIGEIISNCINHSEQDVGYVMYDVQQEQGDFYLYITIVDYGKTITSNVKDYFRDEVISSSECLKWAVKAGNTTRKGSGGYGLAVLIDYIKKVKGTLMIFSGDTSYILTEDESVECESFADEMFYGTSVTLKIKLFDTDKLIDVNEDKIACISLQDLIKTR